MEPRKPLFRFKGRGRLFSRLVHGISICQKFPQNFPAGVFFRRHIYARTSDGLFIFQNFGLVLGRRLASGDNVPPPKIPLTA